MVNQAAIFYQHVAGDLGTQSLFLVLLPPPPWGKTLLGKEDVLLNPEGSLRIMWGSFVFHVVCAA